MTDLIPIPAVTFEYGNNIALNQSRDIKQNFYYFCFNNSASFSLELKSKLHKKLGFKITKKLVKKLKTSIKHLVYKKKNVSGIIKLNVKENVFEMFHYFLRFKSKAKGSIELFLINISEEFDVVKVLNKMFNKRQKKYRKEIKRILNKSEVSYLKMIGKGRTEYEIERAFNYSRVDFVHFKEQLTSKLALRNEKEIYWVTQRCGYTAY